MSNYVSVDPGLVTGAALLSPKGDAVFATEIEGGIEGFVWWWYLYVDGGLPDHVFIEDWMVRPNTHRMTPQPDPYLIIGYVQGWCILNDVPLIKIGPGEHKTFNGKGRKSKVRRIGWVTETTKDGHAEDACSVMLTGLLRTRPDLVTPLLMELDNE